MHSHGWGGSAHDRPDGAFRHFLDAGYGVLSFDQRGFGASGGHAYVENPDVEGHDVRKLVQPGQPPRLGAAGRPGRPAAGRHRRQLRRRLPVPRRVRGAAPPRQAGLRRARPRDHLVRPRARASRPRRSSAPPGRSAPSAASAPSDALPPNVYAALVEGAATGTWPDGSVPGRGEHEGVLQEERPEVARRPRPPPRHPGALRPGHHRLALPAPAGARELEALDHPARPPAQHLRRLQRRPRAAGGLRRRASTSPPTRAASSSRAARSSTCRSGSSTSS